MKVGGKTERYKVTKKGWSSACGAATMRMLPSAARVYRSWLWPRASLFKRPQVRRYARVGAQRPRYAPRYISRRAVAPRCTPLRPAAPRCAPLRAATLRCGHLCTDATLRPMRPATTRHAAQRRAMLAHARCSLSCRMALRPAPLSPDALDAPRYTRRPLCASISLAIYYHSPRTPPSPPPVLPPSSA